MIQIESLTKSFGGRDLFKDASLTIGARDRLALVGPNGSGKTTLLRMIAGDEGWDSGDIRIQKGIVLGHLRQEIDPSGGKSALEEVMSAGSHLIKAQDKMQSLEHEIASLPPGDEQQALLEEYGRIQHRFDHMGGYSLQHEAERILAGLGFRPHDMQRDVAEFSGGWRTRMSLAKLLLSGPDLLLLDEPTNHLDLASVEWLEGFLDGYEGAIVLVSHDREFINSFANRVVEIDQAQLHSYTGDYASFVEQRELRIRRYEQEMAQRARRIAQTQQFINRFRYKASKARQVQSRIKMLDRMQAPEHAPTSKRRSMKIDFPTPPRTGRLVMTLDRVRFAYGDNLVYDALDLVIERGDKLALVGPNGAGKSTLLKLLAGVLEPQSGQRVLGANVAVGYFAQHQLEALDAKNRVLEELKSVLVDGAGDPRRILGRFLFSGDDVDKPVGVLSGGEKSRLALAKMLAAPLNFICLDEPTNHLDMVSRDALEDALSDYQGSLVLITHDRHLIRSVATRIVEVVEGRVTVFDEDYDDYIARRENAYSDKEKPTNGPKAPKAEAAKQTRREAAMERARLRLLKSQVAQIEQEVESLTAEGQQLAAQLADPAIYSSGADIAELVGRYEETQRRLTELEMRWEEMTEKLSP